MYLKQSDLFWRLGHDFVKKVIDKSVKQKHDAGDILFYEGDPASHFYVLIKGRIRLTIGDSGQVVHTISHPGECFGWSSLLSRETYSASAECREPSTLMLINAEQFLRIIEEDPLDGLHFMKHLAKTLGNRLLTNYQMAFSLRFADTVCSFGNSQVLEGIADVQ